MKLASIFLMTSGVTADFEAADNAINEVIAAANTMLNAPAFTDALDERTRRKWTNRIDVITRRLVRRSVQCGDFDA